MSNKFTVQFGTGPTYKAVWWKPFANCLFSASKEWIWVCPMWLWRGEAEPKRSCPRWCRPRPGEGSKPGKDEIHLRTGDLLLQTQVAQNLSWVQVWETECHVRLHSRPPQLESAVNVFKGIPGCIIVRELHWLDKGTGGSFKLWLALSISEGQRHDLNFKDPCGWSPGNAGLLSPWEPSLGEEVTTRRNQVLLWCFLFGF